MKPVRNSNKIVKSSWPTTSPGGGIVLQRCSDGLRVVADNVLISQAYGLLSENIGSVIRIRASALLPEDCWTIIEPSDCTPEICPKIISVLPRCDACYSCWKLTQCETPYTVKIVSDETISNAGFPISPGDVVRLSDDLCYIATLATTCVGRVTATIVAPVKECDSCNDCVYLEECWGPGAVTIYADSHELSIGDVVRIDGVCWEVKDVDICSEFSTPYYTVAPEDIYRVPSCLACGCYKITRCSSGSEFWVYEATDPSETKLNLNDYLDKVIRLDDGNCYTVAKTTVNCDTAISVVIQESYETGNIDECEYCLCYDLTLCSGQSGGNIVSYTDLKSYVGKIIRSADDGKCYTVTGTTAWTVSAVSSEVEETFDECDDCTTPRYGLNPICPPCEDSGSSGCDAEGGGATQVAGSGSYRVTNHILSAHVGKFIKIGGECYQVELAAHDAPVSDGFGYPLTFEGPFDDCSACQQECLWIVHDVLVSGNKLVKRKTKIMVDKICETKEEDIVDIEDCE